MSSYSISVKKTQTDFQWLRDRTSSRDHGLKWEGHPIHSYKNHIVVSEHNSFAAGFSPKVRIFPLSNAKFLLHWDREQTFYFAGNERSQDPETLFMIDIDAHHKGTVEGCREFARYLQTLPMFKGLYWEDSDRGVHCYPTLDKKGCGSIYVNNGLDRLQAYLTTLATGFDIEMVEVKGKLPEIKWGRTQGYMEDYQAGVLATIPRERNRFSELKQTAVLDIHEIYKLKVSTPKPELKKKDKKKHGSTWQPIPDLFIELDGYREVANELGVERLLTTTRTIATKEDVAVFLMLLDWFEQNPFKDGSLPVKRFEVHWQDLYARGLVTRSFDCHRFKVIRDYLSDNGFIDWVDSGYIIGDPDNKIVGQSCKWGASEKLQYFLSREKRLNLIGTRKLKPQTTIEALLKDDLNMEEQEEGFPIIRPHRKPLKMCYLYNPDELTELLEQAA